MDFTLKEQKSAIGKVESVVPLRVAKGYADTEIVGTLLTNYKNVVDIGKTYGLSATDLVAVREKLRLQNNFLEYSYVAIMKRANGSP